MESHFLDPLHLTFNLNLIDLPKLNRIDGELRHYETPTGERYPSVTTVLKHTKIDDGGLDRWRDRVGHAEADRQTSMAATRGTAVHNLCEQYVYNQPINFMREMPLNVMMFKQIKSVLDDHVDNIRISEGFLYSHKLKVAGAVDLVADWDGCTAVVDFKTSRATKRLDWIEDYFIQTAMYSYMLWEMKRIHCKKIVIIIACEEEIFPQVIETDAVKYLDKAIERCKLFHEKS